MERTVNVKEEDILGIKRDLILIKNLLSKNNSQISFEEEMNSWETMSDKTLEDFEDSL